MLLASSGRAQQPSGPTFEVATVKPIKSPDAMNRISIQPGGRLTFSNITLKQLIGTSFQRVGFDSREVIGRPGLGRFGSLGSDGSGEGANWSDPDGFPGPAFAMLRNSARRTIPFAGPRGEAGTVRVSAGVRPARSAPGYAQLRRSTIDCAAIMRDEAQGKPPAVSPGQQRPCAVAVPPGQLRASAVTVSALANVLSSFVGRPVVDRTGLDGAFDIELEFSPESRPGFLPPEPGATPPSGDGPSLFTSIQEQLGLKLTTGRAAVDVLVIDRAERPTPD